MRSTITRPRGERLRRTAVLFMSLGLTALLGLTSQSPAVAAPFSADTPPTQTAKPAEKPKAAEVGEDVLDKAARGAVDVLVAYDGAQVLQKLASDVATSRDKASKTKAVKEAAAAHSRVKAAALASLKDSVSIVQDYDYLPIQLLHVPGKAALDKLAASPGVASIQLPKVAKRSEDHLSTINVPEAVAAGNDGSGMAVAVLDTGVDPDYNSAASDLGDCGFGWGMGTCRIASYTSVSGATALDVDAEDHHGTNVAGIVAQVSPKAKIHVYQVFDGTMTASEGNILAAINAITRDGSELGIRSVNLSLGKTEDYHTTECSGSPMDWAFLNLRGLGILPVVAAGNNATTYGFFLEPTVHVGVAWPACVPGAIRVGAVDSSDLSIPGFSQGGPLLTVRAPGVNISAGGGTLTGTSQATPHVAGAIADVAEANPAASAQQLARAIATSRTSLSDWKDNTNAPLLDVERAAQAVTASQAMMRTSGCATNTLPANDDGSTGSIQLPFVANFYGTSYESLFVNNNGNVTFLNPMSTYTPFNVTASIPPMIAPFFADVDTRGAGSRPVTYGVTTFGSRTAFCVNWDQVGYYAYGTNKLNSFQLLLVDRSDVGAGDFDIVMNYDELTWETGSASGGQNGIMGSAAGAGFSAGDGAFWHFFEFPGSRTPLALLDSNSTTGLVNGSSDSTQAGRYAFHVRNGAAPGSGKITGTVKTFSGTPVAGSAVEACPELGFHCVIGVSTSTGHYSIVGLSQGSWRLRAMPPSGSELQPATVAGVAVSTGVETVQGIVLPQPQAIPAGTTITSHGSANGMPVLYWNDPLTLTTQACAQGSSTFSITGDTGVLASGSLAEEPTGSGTYIAHAPALYPHTGRATVNLTIQCPNMTTTSLDYSVYIDPSGTVRDTLGHSIPGATVTLYRSDASSGPFEVVPDGSALLSPSQRSNPMVTGLDGIFHWDTLAGFYVVKASAPGCRLPGSSETTVSSAILEVPPPALGIELTLECQGVQQQAQSIEFPPLSDRTYGDAPVAMSAVATSGLPVSFAASGACVMAGGRAALTGTGTCTVVASQPGDAAWAAATPVPRTFTVAAKALTVTAQPAHSAYSDPLAALTATVQGMVGSDIISGAASCSTSATSSSPAGTYPITCARGDLSAGPNYALVLVDAVYTVDREGVAIEYTGDVALETASIKATSTAAVLQARLTQENDGHPGDLQRAKVRFSLYDGLLSANPAKVIDNVSVGADGTASTSAQLGIGTWTLKVEISDHNDYWVERPYGVAVLNITQPASNIERRVVGGGWVALPGSVDGKANFGYTVTYNKQGAPRGNAVVTWRDASGYTYVVKSTSWSSGGLAFFPSDPAKARFVSSAVIQKLDSAGMLVASWGNSQLQMTTFDGDLTNPKTRDALAIRVSLSNGVPAMTVGSDAALVAVGGGNLILKAS